MRREKQVANASHAATRRADLLLVERNLFDSRAKAQAAIAAGAVTANGLVVTKASATIPVDAVLDASPAHPYVSRGGVKLAHALAQSGFDPANRICLDVGASTGGFSQVLLGAGARRIYAIDVGTAQLHASLRDNPKIISMENTDIRHVKPTQFSEPPDLAVVDVSFISLRHVIPAVLALLARPAELIALIKPQFEVTRSDLKKGVVRDTAIHSRVCAEIADLITVNGCDIVAQFPSPIAGGDGNREFFIAARRR
jgi:23S rRNA (cytidine1920-2'-O)/16S rRNA (cytidine1409-2'-O)-methyltransferase